PCPCCEINNHQSTMTSINPPPFNSPGDHAKRTVRRTEAEVRAPSPFPLVRPIQSALTKLGAENGQVPNLQAACFDVDGEITAIGAERQGKSSGGEGKEQFESACIVEAGETRIATDPNCLASRRKEKRGETIHRHEEAPGWLPGWWRIEFQATSRGDGQFAAGRFKSKIHHIRVGGKSAD